MKKCIVFRIALLFAMLLIYSGTGGTQNQSAPKGFAFNNPSDYNDYPNLHGGKGIIKYIEGFGQDDFKTNYHFIRMGVIPPKSSIGEYRAVDSEELFIIMSGLVYVTVNGRTGRITEGTMVPCGMGETIGLYNPTAWNVSFAWIAIVDQKGKYNTIDSGNDLADKNYETPCPFTWIPIEYGNYRTYAKSHAHEGQGFLFNTLGSTGSYFNKWRAHTIGFSPGSSIGYHRHTVIEEIYFLASGKARGTVNDVTMDMQPGDCIICPLDGEHGMYNNSTDDVLIIFSGLSSIPGRKMEPINLGDDLTKR